MTRGTLVAAAAAVLVAAGLVAAGVVLTRDDEPAQTAPVQSDARRAVRVAGEDVVTGRRVDLASYRGKPTVIAIWAAWCPPCQEDGPVFARYAREHPEVAFLGVDYQDDPAEAGAFVRMHGWRFPSVADPQGRLAERLGMKQMPTTIVLDGRHREVGRVVGATSVAELERLLARSRP